MGRYHNVAMLIMMHVMLVQLSKSMPQAQHMPSMGYTETQIILYINNTCRKIKQMLYFVHTYNSLWDHIFGLGNRKQNQQTQPIDDAESNAGSSTCKSYLIKFYPSCLCFILYAYAIIYLV